MTTRPEERSPWDYNILRTNGARTVAPPEELILRHQERIDRARYNGILDHEDERPGGREAALKAVEAVRKMGGSWFGRDPKI